MKNYLLLILLVFWSIPNFSQDFQMPKGPSQDLNRGGNLQNSSIADSLMNRFGDKSTRLNKNPDANYDSSGIPVTVIPKVVCEPFSGEAKFYYLYLNKIKT